MLIGINGLAGSGKDTAFKIIQELLEGHRKVVRDAFADRLKLSAARIFYPEIGLEEAVAWCNSLKDEHEEIAHRGMQSAWHDSEYQTFAVKAQMTGREFLQRYGTEAHRDVFGEDFWVRQVLPGGSHVWRLDGRTDLDQHDLLVVTDVRFDNEAAAVRNCGGEVWNIDRPSVAKGDGHASEKPLSRDLIDRVIDNSGSLEDFTLRLDEALFEFGA